MNITAQHVLCILYDCFGVVCEYDFSFCAFLFNQTLVVFYIVNACEGVLHIAECLTVFIQRQHVCVGIYAAVIQNIHIKQVVAYFIGRIAQHQHYLLCALCDTSQADCKTVSAEDGEYNTDCFTAQLCFYVCRNILCGCVVAICTSNNCLCYTDYISFMQLETILLHCRQNGICYDFNDVIPFTDDRCFDTSGNCSCHSVKPPEKFDLFLTGVLPALIE